jgi:hypothetical protein
MGGAPSAYGRGSHGTPWAFPAESKKLPNASKVYGDGGQDAPVQATRFHSEEIPLTLGAFDREQTLPSEASPFLSERP